MADIEAEHIQEMQELTKVASLPGTPGATEFEFTSDETKHIEFYLKHALITPEAREHIKTISSNIIRTGKAIVEERNLPEILDRSSWKKNMILLMDF
ncbi:MAG: hypothetical protein CEO21_21 [Microgenomates group bacterium Gr01-1014_80]|nr:MAG: hypothetical protein CEO21_21 [Microgenomates group bacterium Gr01-1014_80]